VKRFIIVLILLAGGLAAAAFTVPTNAATVNGTAISQNQLNSDLTAIANSPDYQCYLAAQEYVGSNGSEELPPVEGAGQTAGSGPPATATTAFASYYLDTQIGSQILFEQAAQRSLHATSKELRTAKAQLTSQISQTMSEISQVQSEIVGCDKVGAVTGKEILATMPASFVDESARYEATGGLLVGSLAPTTTSDLMRFFTSNGAEFDTACFTVAQYASQSDAEAGLKKATSGTPFAQVAAAAVSGSGPAGCDILYGIAGQLGSSLLTLKNNVVSSPLPYSNGAYLLLEITSRTPTSFAKAESSVREAVAQEGNSRAIALLQRIELHASVSVDPRYGTWKPSARQIAVPKTPTVDDVLNPVVNDPVSASSATTGSPSGSTSPTTGSSG
jgi:hypothetical protein